MTLLGAQRAAAYLASGAGLCAILVSGELSTPIAVAALAAFVVSFFLGERTAGRATILWNGGVLAAFSYLLFAVVIGRLDVVVASSIFAVLLSLNRLFNRRGVRDYALVHLTALLMIAGGAALSAELAFAVCFLVFGIASTWSLTLTQLRAEIEDEAQSNHVADGGASTLGSRKLVSPAFLGGLGGLALAALGLAALVFVMFPRVSFGLWQRRGTTGGASVGFSDSVLLGGHGRIKDDARVAFRVWLPEGEARRDVLDVHWRGATFDTYDGRGWKDVAGGVRHVRMGAERWYDLAPASASSRVLRVELAPDLGTETVFVPEHTTGVRLRPKQLGLRPIEPVRLLRDALGDLSYQPVRNVELPYEIRVDTTPRSADRAELADEETVRARHLEVPDLDPRIAALAAELIGDRPPAEAARRVENHLRAYRYSLDNEPRGPDPLASFLFDVKAGHCEYFASSMVLLLRSGGVPARLVTGFYGGRYVDAGDYYAVRQGDAHAWVEVWLPGSGWMTFDPTPPMSREADLENAWGRLQLWLDGVRSAWRGAVVDYDLGSQLRGLKSAFDIAQDASTRLAASAQSQGLQDAGRALAVMTGLAGLAVVGVVLVRRRRPVGRRAISRTESQKRARAVYLELVKRLARQGVPMPASQTPRELARVAEARGVRGAAIVGRIVERYLAVRYGSESLDADEARSLTRELREL